MIGANAVVVWSRRAGRACRDKAFCGDAVGKNKLVVFNHQMQICYLFAAIGDAHAGSWRCRHFGGYYQRYFMGNQSVLMRDHCGQVHAHGPSWDEDWAQLGLGQKFKPCDVAFTEPYDLLRAVACGGHNVAD